MLRVARYRRRFALKKLSNPFKNIYYMVLIFAYKRTFEKSVYSEEAVIQEIAVFLCYNIRYEGGCKLAIHRLKLGIIYKDMGTGKRYKVIQTENGDVFHLLDLQSNAILESEPTLRALSEVCNFPYKSLTKFQEFEGFEDEELKETARRIYEANESAIGDIDFESIVFITNTSHSPKAMGSTFDIRRHPMNVTTDKKFAIVIYEKNTILLSDKQYKLLIFHELLHIPDLGTSTLREHDIEDFGMITDRFGSRWTNSDEIPDLAEESIFDTKRRFKL